MIVLFLLIAAAVALATKRLRVPYTVALTVVGIGVGFTHVLHPVLLSHAWERHDLSSLELVTYGTEVMPEATLRRLAEVLPGVRLQQTYGLSELGILRSKSRDDRSTWVRLGGEGYELRVRDGLLEVKAHSAMLGYLNAPSPFTE